MTGVPLFSIADADVPRSLRGTALSLRDAWDPRTVETSPPDDLDGRLAAARAADRRSTGRLVAGASAVVIAFAVIGIAFDNFSLFTGPAAAVAALVYADVRARRGARTLDGPWTRGQLVVLRRRGRYQDVPYLLASASGGVPVRRFLSIGRSPSEPGPVWYRGEMRGRRAVLVVASRDCVWATRAAGAIPRGRWAVLSQRGDADESAAVRGETMTG